PGYYPGKPLYRDKRPFNKPQDAKMNAMEEFLWRLYENTNLPRWVFEEELKTLQESLVISPERERISATESLAYGIDESDEMPGAAVRVSINPKDWIEDPGGTFMKSFVW